VSRLVWILIAFGGGIAAGWLATRKFTADWVEAIGTWVGALATIATIIWAVHAFQQESRQRLEDLGREASEKLARESNLAEAVKVRCSGGYADDPETGGTSGPDTWMLKSVWIRLLNGTAEPVTIEHFDLPGIRFRAAVMRRLPSTLTAGEEFRETIDIEPVRVTDDEVSDKNPLKEFVPALRYRVGGVTWERTGDDPPLRVG